MSQPLGGMENLPVAPLGFADLDLRTLHSYLATDDGALVLVLKDDDAAVLLISALGGDWEVAARGAEELATAAWNYAELTRARIRATTEPVGQAAGDEGKATANGHREGGPDRRPESGGVAQEQ